MARLKDALITALIAALLALPLAGVRTVDNLEGASIEWRLADVAVAALLIFIGRLALGLIADGYAKMIVPAALATGLVALLLPFPSHFLQIVAVVGSFVIAGKAALFLAHHSPLTRSLRSHPLPPQGGEGGAPRSGEGEGGIACFYGYFKNRLGNLNTVALLLIACAVLFPFTPLASRYALDVAVMVLTYIMLAWGLNITVGYAGLLDLGYAGFYALGAYCYALLGPWLGIGFWTALPIAGALAVVTALILGLPVLRLRGDYFAIVTLGFGEIVRLVLTNWTGLTNGPNGISGIPRPTLFGLEFNRQAIEAHQTFQDFFGLAYDPMQRVMFLYYVILVLALAVGWGSARLRRLPLGRAWEAFREDEIACAALGIGRWSVKLAAYSMGAAVAGMAGAFFAARQGFVSPESFTFTESATMLAIVILGGIGHPLGIACAAVFVIGMPELFRDLEQYRMLAFGAGMVLIMIWRPGGMISTREPSVRLGEKHGLAP